MVRRMGFITLVLMISVYLSQDVLGNDSEPSKAIEMKVEGRNITGQVVFLYYSNLDEATRFYEDVMGFEATFSLDWVKIYRVTDSSSVGIVDEKRGFLKGSEDKPVMLSWLTDDVDGWHDYLKEKGVKILSPPEDSEETGIRGFVFADSAGYALEFFTWKR